MRTTAVVLLALLFGMLAPKAAGAAQQHVMIANYTYSAATITVRVGDTITWTNHDEAPHDVVAGTFRSPLLDKGKSWTYTFTAAGTFPYYCSVHPDMRAKVVVLAAETAQAPAKPAAPAQQQQPAARQPAAPAAPAATTTTTAAPTASSAAEQPAEAPVPQTQAAQVIGQQLDPMLIVAGIVAAIAVLCLLLISARPDP